MVKHMLEDDKMLKKGLVEKGLSLNVGRDLRGSSPKVRGGSAYSSMLIQKYWKC